MLEKIFFGVLDYIDKYVRSVVFQAKSRLCKRAGVGCRVMMFRGRMSRRSV